MTVRIAALYRFARFADPAAIRAHLEAVAEAAGIRGTLLIAGEGINGTIAGSDDGIETMLAAIRALPGCADLAPKFAEAAAIPFHRLKVREKREIVTMGVPDIDPLDDVGTYVAPADWNALIDDPDTVVVDTRNDYEVAIGSFKGAVDPATASFRDFPAWVAAHRDDLAGKRVAMFCTGGIRCEKATAYLKREGVDDVFHLDGGILRYLEEMPAADSRWQGECFVFDERVAVGQGLAAGTHVLCRGCRMPVSANDRTSPLFVEGVSCPGCHGSRDTTRQAGYAERHRQVKLAEARGETHVGKRVEPSLPG
ncbi:oxygen-dependent tRNA uridine(34) hydroxylase TrhO [Sphingomonas sp. CFBP 8760]|uniref:oxygen-dependent tRNA uridine(34) hydroxylase TrhO n=1 Tax=Sphingomonas sp. CFBP 8760 TaxID=2775282 RepID=UPI00177A765C|nr:rhodanese-related sulfurtransferase [Sphingomonas sp. CFBP 8760]MBD8546976.1 rhodanese-related sulfurtransferase [Sphingomonas sp. CFBP 8760]